MKLEVAADDLLVGIEREDKSNRRKDYADSASPKTSMSPMLTACG